MGAPNVLQAIVHGFTSGAMLIIAIGAQNAFVLRQGLRREQVPGVVLVCALSDALLIQAGVWGGGGGRAVGRAADAGGGLGGGRGAGRAPDAGLGRALAGGGIPAALRAQDSGARLSPAGHAVGR